MDANKLKELQEIGYEIPATCGLCRHGDFRNLKVGDPWGSCGVHQYQHLKHTGDKRQLSVHVSGRCGTFERDEARVAQLGAFGVFLGVSSNG